MFSRAEDLLEQALLIRQRKLGPNDPRTVATRSDLAAAYLAKGKYEEAVREFEMVLAFLEGIHGRDAVQLVDPLVGAAAALNAYGDSGSADGYSQRALAIGEKAWGATGLRLLPVLEVRTAVLRKLKRESQAALLESRVAAIRAEVRKK